MESEEEDFSGSEELSSDEELQAEFLRGSLKPGLVARNTPKKTYTNNVLGLREKLAFLRTKQQDWLERLDVTAAVASSALTERKEGEDPGNDDSANPEDDFKREMNFLEQAQTAALTGLRKLEELDVPTQRPQDYYAEMVKTDDHMRKVREKLLGKQKILEHKEKARKLREQKKYGKKVQQETLQKRREDKKAALDAVKKFRKGRGGKPSFLRRDREEGEEDSFPVATEKDTPAAKDASRRKPGKGKSKRRELKDAKFGRGGRKKWRKSNTASSSADMAGFSSVKDKPAGPVGRRQTGAGRKSAKKPVRLGKSRRQEMRMKR